MGQPIDADTRNHLRRQVRNYARRERGPEAYIQMLAAAIRYTARSNRFVGRNLMAISLPRTAVERIDGLSIPLTAPLQNREVLVLYMSESGKATIRYAPNYTCDGMSYKQGFARIEP